MNRRRFQAVSPVLSMGLLRGYKSTAGATLGISFVHRSFMFTKSEQI